MTYRETIACAAVRLPRGQVISVEQLFTGYAALPAPIAPNDRRSVLRNPQSLDEAETAYRQLILTAHPDAGGSQAAAALLNAAIAEARRDLT